MPEGDVVWYTARRLHEALAGRVLTRSDFRVPRFATVNLAGQTVTQALARGKHLLIRTSGGLTVHTHLKMDGSWRIRPAADSLADSHRIRLLLANAEWQAAGYLLGTTEVLPTGSEHDVTGHLGPDLLGPDWDPAEAVRRLTTDKDRARGRGPCRARATRAPAARRQQDAARARVDRGHQARQGKLGVRARGPAMPALRDRHQAGRAGSRGSGTAQVLVPDLPAIAWVRAARRSAPRCPSGWRSRPGDRPGARGPRRRTARPGS
ncbi:DNA-formamidopyrimidine glycosylase family protein [Trebonia sp.]|uniref:DNA-formamidopyrimidine glycosylase family protein n=1 Tax=Trebonia sp. TaxID=2767075 RepID=UPI002625B531|nr:DNA-formamidopyrimidine glycosylase family protein [Trebonia sp.]